MIKIDEHTNAAIRGRFVRLTVCVDLKKSLISKVKINGKTQRVECEFLPNICFTCGMYGHNSALCSSREKSMEENTSKKNEPIMGTSDLHSRVEQEPFGPWIVMERRQRRKGKEPAMVANDRSIGRQGDSRFSILETDGAAPEAENYDNNSKNIDENSIFHTDLPKFVSGKFMIEKTLRTTGFVGGGKKGDNKAKGKRIVVNSGPMKGVQILRKN